MIISDSIKKQAGIKINDFLSSEQLPSLKLIYHTKAVCKVLLSPTKTVCYQPMNDITMTKDITEIFACSEKSIGPHFIMIEGAPGIGKTVLAKEICYQWANEQILQNFMLVFLLQLQDPALRKLSNITHLLQLLCQRGTNFPNITPAYVDHLLKSNGKDVLFIFDGFDEFSNNLQKNSSNVIIDILKQEVLPQCSILVTSRPCASEIFNYKITTKVKLLGFTRDEVKLYIETAMKGEPHKISNLIQYLDSQPMINYYLPINIAILVYLFKHELSLPASSAELYHTFICHTISHHLAKCGIQNITDVTDLPEPYYKRFQQLAKLAYETVNINFSFTLDEFKTACPYVKGIDDEYGLHLGLLEEVNHISHHMTYKFVNFSIQEFLAAWHISTLQSIELELKILKEYLWRDDYFKVFSMHAALTKGQTPSFKKFLSGNEIIPIVLEDQLKCFRLFHYFYEAGNTEFCHYLEQSQIFKDQTIELLSNSLSDIDIECIVVFLTWSSHKKWQELNLYNCGIKDHGIYFLHRGLLASNTPSITMLQLSYNGLTEVSSSLVSDIVVNCNVKKLKIDGNHSIGENKLCCTMLNNMSKLECLHLVDTNLSSIGLDSICKALIYNNTLKELVVTNNNINDDACTAIIMMLKDNNFLAKLWMWKNPIHSDSLTSILKALQGNDALAFLGLPSCSEVTKMSLESLQEVVNEKRESRGCQVKLVIDFM